VGRLRWLVAALLPALAIAGCSGSSGVGGNPVSINSPAATFVGAPFEPAKHLPDVTLTDTAGRPWNLKARGQGHITVTYFGYTNCTDTCPHDMAEIATAIRELPASMRTQVQVVFVTVDLRRDTQAVIQRWLDRFDRGLPSFVGLRGSAAALTAAARGLGLQFKISTTTAGLEEVEHSSQLTAFGRTGTSNLIWLDPTSPHDVANDLRLLIDGTSPV
jgi:protein SCO1/2